MIKKSVIMLVWAVCLLPLPARGQFGKIIRKQLNGLFTAEVDFSSLRVSFIRKFPRTYLSLENFRMIGTGAFEGDTLVACRKATVVLSLGSLIRRKHVKIKSIRLEEPGFYAHILADGQANWQILKSKAKATPEETPPSPPATPPPPETERKAGRKAKPKPETKFSTGRIEVCDADIAFRDDRRKMRTAAKDMDILIVEDPVKKGAAAGWTVELHVADLDFRTGNSGWVQHAHLDMAARICPDANRRMFELEDGRLRINEVELLFGGRAGKQDGDLIADLAFDTGHTDFKHLLSLVPAIALRADFDSLLTAGSFSAGGAVKGTFNKRQKPAVNFHLRIDSARLGFPGLPEAVERIRLAMHILYDGAVFDRSAIDIDRLHLAPGGRPFDLSLHLQTPQSDLRVAGAMKGTVRLDSLARAIPLRDVQLTGFMESDLSLDGRMSALEKEPFEDFHAQGMLELNSITLINNRFPEGADVPNLSVNFTPRVVKMLKTMLSGIKK
ncbi:MAG: hypothetical protein LBT76_05210 [Tannerella sp.]|nr:hypothetical protein [Tannerella sp.]